MAVNSAEKRERAREWLRKDYERETGQPFQHFFCPVLFTDEEVELCLGHIVCDSIPNSCKSTVLQRKNVDGFYGTLLENHFATVVKANKPSLSDILTNPKLRREIPWTVNVDGKAVPHYEPKAHKSPKHPTVQLRDATGDVLKIALKISDEELIAAGSLQIVVDRSYVPESTASLLKSAHLTMFRIFGYRHIFSPAGIMVSEILRTFYLNNRVRSRREQTEAANAYFPQHAGMIIPIAAYDKNLLRGTIEDRRFIRCVGSSGSWFALGVFVRTGDMLHAVFLPPDDADHMDTYFDFIGSMEKKTFVFQFMDFVPGDKVKGPCWTGYQKEYSFDPALRGVA